VKRQCQSKAECGACCLEQGHEGPHGVGIGPGYWFAYTRRTLLPLGYTSDMRTNSLTRLPLAPLDEAA